MSSQELLKVYSSYLPYGVKSLIGNVRCNIAYLSPKKIAIIRKDGIGEVEKYKWEDLDKSRIKLALRPLSDLTKEDYKEELLTYYEGLGISIKHMSYYDSGNNNPSDFTILVTYKMLDDVFTDCLINRSSISESPYHFVKWLHQNHFDTDGLIEKGLAINLNEMK